MVSLIASPSNSLRSPCSVMRLNTPRISSVLVVISPQRRLQKRPRPPAVCLKLVASVKHSYSLGFWELGRRIDRGSWCCGCKSWESDEDAVLEAEILEFMKKSEKPEAFPTKEELVRAGRMDLAEAIKRKGGWWSLGWDSDEDNNVDEKVRESAIAAADFDVRDFQFRADNLLDSSSIERDHVGYSDVSSSGRSMDIVSEEDSGVEGILSRLEKQRNLSLGVNLTEKGYINQASRERKGSGLNLDVSEDSDSSNYVRSNKLSSSIPDESIRIDALNSPLKHETWRSWSTHRAGLPDTRFEAAEISFDENGLGEEKYGSKERVSIPGDAFGHLDSQEEMNHSEIRTRLQHLELELASALQSLRSKSNKLAKEEDHETSSTDPQKLYDAWEFQQNEIMNAQGRLRSLRAKLAVLEGKMTLAIIDAQKIAEEKQKRIDGARRALKLLRTACIVWPNSASQVLLTGSFDGWTTQKKMEKSGRGGFSVYLKLYPGRYEIKFIVDGTWRIDPLRPVVHNNGYENNLLIIT